MDSLLRTADKTISEISPPIHNWIRVETYHATLTSKSASRYIAEESL